MLRFREFFFWAKLGFDGMAMRDGQWLLYLGTYLPNCAIAELLGLPCFCPDWHGFFVSMKRTAIRLYWYGFEMD